ncbi:hypothetical protein DL95DRAFT_386919, partial [Leptodontidium sp. 2 PMI_412]
MMTCFYEKLDEEEHEGISFFEWGLNWYCYLLHIQGFIFSSSSSAATLTLTLALLLHEILLILKPLIFFIWTGTLKSVRKHGRRKDTVREGTDE